MKKLYTLITGLVIFGSLIAQAPVSFKYQAVLRDARGNTRANTTAVIGIDLLQGSALGITVYRETHNVTTDGFGLINIEIGKGTASVGSLSVVDWSAGPYFIKVIVDGIEMGTSQLLSVPYALYAKAAGNGFSGSYNDLTAKPALFDGTWSSLTGRPAFATVATTGTYNDLKNKPVIFSGDYSSLTGKPTLSLVASTGSYTSLLNKPVLFDGTWTNLTGKPALFDGTWTNLSGKPTTVDGFGITDAVTTIGDQTVGGNKILSDKLAVLGNSSVGTSTPEASAALDVHSTKQGFLPPRMTYAQKKAIAGPVAGLIIWCNDCGAAGEIQVFNGTTWTNMIGNPASASLPQLSVTTAITLITGTTASTGGNITDDGGAAITARGVCWSTTANPTFADSKTTDGTGTGVFTSSITGLSSGTTYYVRAYSTNSIGTSYGSQVSFTTASPVTQVSSEQIISSGKTGFGNSIAVSGNLAVIGAGWENTEQANKAGAVYVYEFINNQWDEKQRITNPNGSYDKIFGQSVATNGNYIVITEPWARSAHIYSKSGSLWVLEKTITVTDVPSEVFGISCDIYENTIVIGSGAVFAVYCSAVGSAYVYEKNGTDWNHTAILKASDGLPHDGFGAFVSIDNTTIAVGAGKTDCYAGSQGSVYIYEKNGINWPETQKLTAPDGIFGDRFGGGVEIENENLIVSAVGNAGLYYYRKGATWEYKQKIVSPSLSGTDNFGWPVSLSNNKLLIGAHLDSEFYNGQGAAYVFEFDGTNWISKLKVTPSDSGADDKFGFVLHLNNSHLFVSKYLGNVYAFKLQ